MAGTNRWASGAKIASLAPLRGACAMATEPCGARLERAGRDQKGTVRTVMHSAGSGV